MNRFFVVSLLAVAALLLFGSGVLTVRADAIPDSSLPTSGSCANNAAAGACCTVDPNPPTQAESQMWATEDQVDQEMTDGTLQQVQALDTDSSSDGAGSYMNTVRDDLGIPEVTYYDDQSSDDVGTLSQGKLCAGKKDHWFWVCMQKYVEPDGGCSSSSSCSGGSCYGTANGYTNPRMPSAPPAYYYNMCGPGSSEAVISSWNDHPRDYDNYYYTGYIANQGLHWLAYMFSLSNGEQGVGGSCSSNYATCTWVEKNWINHEIGWSFYRVDYCAAGPTNPNCSGSQHDNWTSDVHRDITDKGVPLVDEVKTCNTLEKQCLAGWPYRADHFQAISQVDIHDGLVKYGETGSAADTCYFGYGQGAPGHFSGSFLDPHTAKRTPILTVGTRMLSTHSGPGLST